MMFVCSSCADISIGSMDNNDFVVSLSTTTIPQEALDHIPLVDSVIFPSEIEQLSYFTYPTTTTTTIEPSTTTAAAEMMNFVYPFHPSDQLFNRLNKIDKTLRCYPTHEVLKPLVGIEDWCLKLCAEHCPPTLCVCVHI